MQSFGIPAGQASEAALREQLQEAGRLLADVSHRLTLPLAATLTENDREIDRITGRLRRRLSGVVAGNNRRINPIGRSLTGQVITTTAANQAMLNQTIAQTPQFRSLVSPTPDPTLTAAPPSPGVTPVDPYGPPPCDPGGMPTKPASSGWHHIDRVPCGGGASLERDCLFVTLAGVGLEVNNLYGHVPAPGTVWVITDGPFEEQPADCAGEVVSPGVLPPIVPAPPSPPSGTVSPPPPPSSPPGEVASCPIIPPAESCPVPARWQPYTPNPEQAGFFEQPGTVDFCDNLAERRAWLARVGREFLTAIEDAIGNVERTADAVVTALESIEVAGISLVSGALRTAIRGMFLPITETIANWKKAIGIFGPMELETAIPLTLLRSIIVGLESVPTGINLGALSTVNFSVAMTSIVRVIDYYLESIWPTTSIQPEQAMTLWAHDLISERHCQCIHEMHGRVWEIHRPLIEVVGTKASPYEVVSYGYRTRSTEEDIRGALKRVGVFNPVYQSMYIGLHEFIPPVTDLVRFGLKDLQDEDIVTTFGLKDEFGAFWSGQLRQWAEAQGITEQVALMYHMAAWENIPRTHADEFLHRFRPGRHPSGLVFTAKDHAVTLRRNDILQKFRPFYEQASYHVPAMSYVVGMYRDSTIDDAELAEMLQDLGYNAADAAKFVPNMRYAKARIRASQGNGWTPSAIAKAFATRSKDAVWVQGQMSILGYTPGEAVDLMERADTDLQYTITSRARSRVNTATIQQVKEALTVGILTDADARQALIGLGWTEQQAEAWVNAQLATAHSALVKQTISRIRSAYLDGEIDGGNARGSLNALGLSVTAVDHYLSAWAMQNTPRRKRRTAKEIVNDVYESAVSVEDAIVRLTNLGYDDADTRLYLADASRKVREREAKLLADREKLARITLKENEKLQEEARQQVKDLQNAIRKIASPAKLAKWLIRGIIDEGVFRERLLAMGIPAEDVHRYHAEASRAQEEEAGNGQTEPAGEGTGGSETG